MYVSTLCAYQPHKGPDMLAYLHVIASEHEEFQFAACMAYNVAFTKMAANFRLSSRGHIDPQVFSKHLPALARQSLVLTAPFAYPISIALLTALCTPVGQPRRHRLAWLASKCLGPLHNGKEISQLEPEQMLQGELHSCPCLLLPQLWRCTPSYTMHPPSFLPEEKVTSFPTGKDARTPPHISPLQTISTLHNLALMHPHTRILHHV